MLWGNDVVGRAGGGVRGPVARACGGAVLSFTAAEPELTISDLERRSRLPRTTVHCLVVNLVRLGFLTRDARSERYRLGLLLSELGTIALSRMVYVRKRTQSWRDWLANR